MQYLLVVDALIAVDNLFDHFAGNRLLNSNLKPDKIIECIAIGKLLNDKQVLLCLKELNEFDDVGMV